MSFYTLYSLPPGFSETENREAIEKECYFAILVKYIDGNSVRIYSIIHINPDYREALFNILQPGNDLSLEQMRYLTKYHRRNPPWEPAKYKWEAFQQDWVAKSKILLKSNKK